jgi:hypothetical protein
MASTISPEDTVVIVQNGFNKKLPVSYLLAAGQSGFSGFSGISGFSGANGLNGEFAASGFSGFSGASGISGFSGISPILDIKPSHLIYSDENGKITEVPNITSHNGTLELVSVGEGSQLSIKPEKGSFKSIQTTVSIEESNITFQNNPYSSTTISSENESGDLVIKSATYGKESANVIRLKNSDQTLHILKKVTTATPSKESAGFNLPVGERPANIKDGDMWRESEGVFIQDGNKLVGPLSSTANISSWNKIDAIITTSNGIRSLGECSSNHIFFRRVGDSMECRIDIRQQKGVDGNAGEYFIVIPNDLSLDSDKINIMDESSFGTIGQGTIYDGIPNTIAFQPRSNKHMAIIINNRTWSSNNHNLSNNIFNLIGTFTIPIAEWK